MNTNENSIASETQRLAGWVLKLAKSRSLSAAKLAAAVDLSSSYFVKLKRGDIAQFPFEKMEAIAKVLSLSTEEIFDVAGVRRRSVSAAGLPERPGKVGRPSFDRPPDKLKFVFHQAVPDHCWPMIALKKKFFEDVNIELEASSKPLSAYPKSHQECANDGNADTIFIMPLPSMEAEPNESNYFQQVTPIAISHHYHGFPFIGRNPSRTLVLAESPSMDDFDDLMRHLDARNVLGSRCVACVAQPEKKFVKAVWDLARQRPSINVQTATGGAGYGEVPLASSDSFLEELWEIGNRRQDFVVGHAMSLAIALKNTNRYKVIFDFKKMEAVVDSAIAEADLEKGTTGETNPKIAALKDIKDSLNALRLPVALVLNTGVNSESKPTDRHGLILRLRAVVHRTVEQVLKNISDNAADEILEKMEFPESRIGDHPADAASLRKAWQRCYSFDQAVAVTEPAGLVKKINDVTAEMERHKTESRQLIDKSSDPIPDHIQRAKWHFDNFNYFDALRCANESPTDSNAERQNQSRSKKKV